MSDAFSLAGRVALVTGGARDMGRAISLALAGRGADVVVAYGSSEAAAAETVAAIESAGRRALAVHADVTDSGQVERLVGSALEWSGGRIDVLVNNAGGLIRRESILAADVSLFVEALELNYLSAVRTCRLVLPAMVEAGYGRVVNVGSIAGNAGGGPMSSHYAAAKAALASLARSLTKEVSARGVTVNTVAPGIIDNAFHVVHTPRPVFDELVRSVPAGRAGTDEDVAHAVCYLASPGAGYVTGQVVHVDGGMYFGQ